MRIWEIQFQKGWCSWQSYMSVLVQKLHLRGWRRRRSKVFPERDERRIHVGTSIPGLSTHPSYVPWAVWIFEMIRCFSDKFGYWYYHVMVVRVNLVGVVGQGCRFVGLSWWLRRYWCFWWSKQDMPKLRKEHALHRIRDLAYLEPCRELR